MQCRMVWVATVENNWREFTTAYFVKSLNLLIQQVNYKKKHMELL